MKTIQKVIKNDFYMSIIKDLTAKLIADTSMPTLQ